MSRSLRARWMNSTSLLVVGVVMFALNRDDGVVWALVLPLLFVAGAVVTSPLLKRQQKSVSHREALALTNPSPDSTETGQTMSDSNLSNNGDSPNVVIYHRPGCSFCARMKMALRDVADRAVWVDIWEDDEAAAFVRSVNNGNETVPTVVIDGKAHTNPSPAQVHDAIIAA